MDEARAHRRRRHTAVMTREMERVTAHRRIVIAVGEARAHPRSRRVVVGMRERERERAAPCYAAWYGVGDLCQ